MAAEHVSSPRRSSRIPGSRSRSLYRSPGTPIGKSIDYLDFATIKLPAPAYVVAAGSALGSWVASAGHALQVQAAAGYKLAQPLGCLDGKTPLGLTTRLQPRLRRVESDQAKYLSAHAYRVAIDHLDLSRLNRGRDNGRPEDQDDN